MPDQPSRSGRRYSQLMTIKTKREKDGRWIAKAHGLPDVVVYGDTETEARTKALDLALQVLSSPSSTSSGASEPESEHQRFYFWDRF